MTKVAFGLRTQANACVRKDIPMYAARGFQKHKKDKIFVIMAEV